MPLDYLLLMYRPDWTEENPRGSDESILECAEPVVKRTVAAGQFLAAGVLRSTAAATSVRVKAGRTLVTDGPFAETREQLAGYLLIRARDLDEAIRVAAEHPVAQGGTVEIRPVMILEAPTTLGAR